MSKGMTLTEADMKTIRLALHYAAVERDSYADATVGTLPKENKRANDLVARFDKLHRKLFGEDTAMTMERRAMDALPTIDIFSLAARNNAHLDD